MPSQSNSNIQYDLFLSYSQSYNASDATDADQSTQYLIDNFHSFQWSKCFDNIYRIETGISAEEDLYLPSEASTNPMWVHGPNQQFLQSMNIIQKFHSSFMSRVRGGGGHYDYDYVVVMESDVLTIKSNWLDDLMEEAEQRDFCMLGSKYAGQAWDGFRSSLPLALQHHLNGNAVYNLHHPLFEFLLKQLWRERDTLYHAVPYDYRISQILVEGFLGVKPELPGGLLVDGASDAEAPRSQTEEFRKVWNRYGIVDGEATMRESEVIRNYVGSPLLPRHLKNLNASLIHGAIFWLG